METPTLAAYIQPSIYSDEAIASARAGKVGELSTDLCIVRFWLALRDVDNTTAQDCLTRLSSEKLGGWPLYQVKTGAVFLTIQQGDKAAILAAIDAWLTGLSLYPGNWQTGVLQAPEVAQWLAHFDPKRFIPPRRRKRRLTAKQRVFVRDIDGCIAQAIADNLVWLKELGFTQRPTTIATWYKLSEVNLKLCEATLEADTEAPTLIVALDANGNYTSSFITH